MVCPNLLVSISTAHSGAAFLPEDPHTASEYKIWHLLAEEWTA